MNDRAKQISDLVINAVRHIVPDGFVPLHTPILGDSEKTALGECIDSTFVSTVGPRVDEFKQLICDFVGCEFAVPVVNGTAGLSLALIAAGVNKDEEVLVPTLSFVATANAVCHVGAIPHFLDADQFSPNISPTSVRDYLTSTTKFVNGRAVNQNSGRVISAIIPVHIFGHPVDIDGFIELADEFGMVLVEDAAESLGSYYKGRHTANFGLCGVFSFNGNKIITTGGGGVVVTNDRAIADLVTHLSTTAKTSHRWRYIHDEVGYNYRMPNINAALGCAQMGRLSGLLEAKSALTDFYQERINHHSLGVNILNCREDSQSNYWLQAIVIQDGTAEERDMVLDATNSAGIMTRPLWDPLHTLPMFSRAPRMEINNANRWFNEVINIPSNIWVRDD